MTSTRRRRVEDVACAVDLGRAVTAVAALILAAAVPVAAAEPDAAPLTLERAIALALERNETPATARERVRAAEARVSQARSLFFPDLTLAGSYARSSGQLGGAAGDAAREARDAVTGTATVTLPLFEPSSVPLYRRARLDREGTRLEASDTRDVLAFDVASSFFGALSAEQVLAAAERRLQLARATHADARDRAAAGLVGSNDVTRAELELWSAERDLTRARSALEIARIQLEYLLDAPVPGTLAVPAAVLEEAAAARGALDGVERRKDVRALQLRADALRTFADEPRWRLLPRLALSGQLRTVSDDGFADFRNDGVLGATLTWVLWDGGLREAERRERLALASAGDLERRAAARGTDRDREEALTSLRGGQEAAQAAEAAAQAARRNSEESTILYRQGLAPALAVADASTRLFEAEVDLARAQLDLAQAFLALRRASGLDPLGRHLP